MLQKYHIPTIYFPGILLEKPGERLFQYLLLNFLAKTSDHNNNLNLVMILSDTLIFKQDLTIRLSKSGPLLCIQAESFLCVVWHIWRIWSTRFSRFCWSSDKTSDFSALKNSKGTISWRLWIKRFNFVFSWHRLDARNTSRYTAVIWGTPVHGVLYVIWVSLVYWGLTPQQHGRIYDVSQVPAQCVISNITLEVHHSVCHLLVLEWSVHCPTATDRVRAGTSLLYHTLPYIVLHHTTPTAPSPHTQSLGA